MADNGKLQFFGQTVYPQTTVSNILNDDGTQWTPPPTPTTADNGKVLGVTNGAYALQEASGGGGTQLYRHCFTTDYNNSSTGQTTKLLVVIKSTRSIAYNNDSGGTTYTGGQQIADDAANCRITYIGVFDYNLAMSLIGMAGYIADLQTLPVFSNLIASETAIVRCLPYNTATSYNGNLQTVANLFSGDNSGVQLIPQSNDVVTPINETMTVFPL